MKKITEKISIIVLITGIVFVYVWFITAGKIRSEWPHTHNYYELLSQSFLHGELYLLILPGPELLALQDPYDPALNKGLTIADATLYREKFYLNWGPVPALIISLVHLFTKKPIYDSFVVFGFLVGSLIFNTLIILWIKQRIFFDLPMWVVFPMILLVGLRHPIPWLLGRPAIYEAAITAGQFFLISGVYWGLSALETSPPNLWKLTLAGVSWSFAVGSRISLLVAVLFLFFVIILIILRQSQEMGWSKLHSVAIFLFVSQIIIGLLHLGFYNYVRFGSFFETGVQYTLTGGLNQHLLMQEEKLVSAKYIIPNFINYVSNGYNIKSEFPYLVALYGNSPANQIQNFNFKVEVLTGIIWALPFVLFSLYLGGKTIVDFFCKVVLFGRSLLRLPENNTDLSRMYVPIIFGGGSLLCFLPLLPFYGATMRYEEDFVPFLLLLSIWGFWRAFEEYSQSPIMRKYVVSFAVVLSTVSIFISFLLGITSYKDHFMTNNPELIVLIRSALNFVR